MAQDEQPTTADVTADEAMRDKREADDAAAAQAAADNPDQETPDDGLPDDDAAELAAFQEQAKAEQSGHVDEDDPLVGEEEDPNQPVVEPEEEAPATADATDDDQGEEEESPGQPMIPKVRFDEQVGKEREAAHRATTEAAYWKGQADALARASGQPGADQPAAEVTPADQITALRAEQQAIAEKYDNGELEGGYPEATRLSAEIEDKIFQIRADQLTPTAPATTDRAPDFISAAVLTEMTQQLEDDHPYSREGVLNDEQWGMIRELAEVELVRQNIPLDGTPQSQFQARQILAQLTDKWGPNLTGLTVEEVTASQAQPLPSAGKPSVKAEARRAKLALAAGHPVDINRVGEAGGQPDSGVPSDAEIEAMTEDEIMALPKSIRQKITEGV